MASITTEQFNKQVEEQKLDAIKWRELEENKIYTIVSVEYVNTQYGEACILTLSDGNRVFAPSALITRLKREEKNKEFPRHVRPKGRKQSKKNPAQTYYSFDLV